MKKFLLFFIGLISIGFINDAVGQCTVNDIVITRVVGVQNLTGGVDYVIDVEFSATTNAGNKQVFFHVWKELEYPQATMHPNPFNCTGNQAVAPRPASFNSGSNQIDILDNAFLNFGFNVNALSVYPAFSTAGITTSYLDWDNTGAITLNSAGATVSKESLGADVDRIRINNLTFTVPNQILGAFLQVRPFNWATNGTGGKPQCWGCTPSLVIGDPDLSGALNCPLPNGNRTYNIIIDSKYDLVTTGVETIMGTYELWIDKDFSGTASAGDVLAQTSTAFTTGNVAPPAGFTSRYAGIGLSLNNYTYSFGDPNIIYPLVAKVTVTTPGYLGGAVSEVLAAFCNTLPVSLKNFNAVQRSGKALLTWETAQENNNDGFEVQRRIGNGKYETIGFVDSKAPGGTGSAYAYSFDDNSSLAKGVTYYRLRQVDLDSKANYSEVRAIRTGGGKILIAVYPNPSRGTTNVAIPEGTGTMDVTLDDFAGKSVQRWSGLNVRNLQLNNLKPGMYLLRITIRETGEQITERIAVQ